MYSSLASIGLLYSSLASIGRTVLTTSTWCALLLFFVSMRTCLAFMRLIATREVTRGSIIMSDDLLSSGQCEDPPGRDGKSGRYRRYIFANFFLAGANF